MSEFKNKYSVFEIDQEDGALKFLYTLNTNYVPQIGETIAYIIDNENGEPVRRLYHKIQNIILPVVSSDNSCVVSCFEPVIHAILEVDEPILNGIV